MSARTVAAVDLGAESGRVMAVSFDGTRLQQRIVNRFANVPHEHGGRLRWDVDRLGSDIDAGLTELAAGPDPVASVGVDTWGVDYGLFDADGALLEDPMCYRDGRRVAALERALRTVGPERLYNATGVQILSINGIFGMMDDAEYRPDLLRRAETLQMMPDVFHHLLSGATVTDYTAASTSGAYDMAGNRWATELLDDLGVPTGMLPEVVAPGTDVGALRGATATGALAGARVIVPAGHDTASAVVAVPYVDDGAMFISSGTWSLAGVEVDKAVVSETTRAANLTNEGGYRGSIRLLRNVMGLWILQECRRQWQREGVELSYPELADQAAAADGLVSIINPDAQEFLPPGDMPTRIREYCARTGQPVPQSFGAVARCILDSLALGYRSVLEDVTAATGERPPSISVVGGGVNNVLLSQLTSDAAGVPVHCGPAEATALGNAAVQLVALGELDGPEQIREVVAAGTEITSYLPRSDARWSGAAEQLQALREADLGDGPGRGSGEGR
ncbi:rhamnulokinase [Nakamurella lactea]|uniref:rhamnulokinase n=1 Tax=Nakamurella lactea TaxID=459515 RepID=UPI0006868CF2|nr:rhamnulokinase family protein [Nakamurella lactea]